MNTIPALVPAGSASKRCCSDDRPIGIGKYAATGARIEFPAERTRAFGVVSLLLCFLAERAPLRRGTNASELLAARGPCELCADGNDAQFHAFHVAEHFPVRAHVPFDDVKGGEQPDVEAPCNRRDFAMPIGANLACQRPHGEAIVDEDHESATAGNLSRSSSGST